MALGARLGSDPQTIVVRTAAAKEITDLVLDVASSLTAQSP
jgi:hypothetical protein